MTGPHTRELPSASVALPQGIAVTDLFLDAAQVVAHLRQSVNAGDWLDAYLFAAGLSQLVDDDLHPDPASLRRAAAFLRAGSSPTGAVAAAVVGAAATGLAPLARTRRRRALRPLRMPLRALVDALAGVVLDPAGVGGLDGKLRRLLDRSADVAELLGDDILRMPAAFRSFDQHPDDVDRLAAATMRAHLRPAGPVCVVGVRTSGSYLAPLFAAALRRRGLPHVEVLTYRPHRAFHRDEVDQLQRVCGAAGRVVVVDDPPGSGSSMAVTASAVARAGLDPSAIVLAACVFPDADQVPPLLARWATVTLNWAQWSVHERLSEAAVADTLAGFVGPRMSVAGVRRTSAPAANGRTHVRARYAVTLRDADGCSRDRDIVVEGAGLGWFGRHAIAVSDTLLGWTPRVLGFADGLLFTADAPTQRPAADASAASQIAGYCAYRHGAIPAQRDPTGLMRGRDPVWEVGAALLARMFGRLEPLARPLLLEPLIRRLLRVENPSVVDGHTDLGQWRVDPEHGRLVKLASYERAFGHLEAACYDAVFDLAGAATDASVPGFEALLRADYERMTGAVVRAEAWLLYRLVHLWRMGRAGDLDATAVARGSALAVTQYLAGIHLAGVGASGGPLCALDLDGVLESDPLGYPATTPSGTLALRSLIKHGYRPVIATGRSVLDARELCQVLGLAGAVAEYGTAVYLRDDDRIVDLRTDEQRARLERVRGDLALDPDITLDPRHQYALRARSANRPLRTAQLAPLAHAHGAEMTVVRGQAQTDITVAGLDKATALRELGRLLGGDAACALAVGDGPADVSMLAAARTARAPANAAREVRAAGTVVERRAYQAGLSDAVGQLLGHQPGTCATCRPPRPTAPTAALMQVLALRENGVGGLASRTVRLSGALARLAVSRRW